MSGRQVQRVMPISAPASSPAVEIGQTNSILSDPDSRWVAKRQREINEAFEKRMRLTSADGGRAKGPSNGSLQHLKSSREPVAKLSGESDRIGRHWDEDIPFGKRVAFF